ncbi:SagB-type dehydrogenase domain-containing protein [Filimonas lacunae]|uniref:SagB-type dehydrogenase domain-containing protein n=1 Tax=Filimonas lacunae TaxID=477680 RepID=A0A173MBJ4_9BACT|nr:SagB/ThcOx family dehydrogenase [Filimonas lacunae]BAV04869.1 hypothetical protein FLA_0869 [Filimonas lacunae]SIT34640.1 SagB-type dehydrogenase domain-containing protein [Filimonas lacunae]
MKFRRARSLFFTIQKGEIYVQNFLQNKTIKVSLEELSLITGMDEWVGEEFLLHNFIESATADDRYDRLTKLIICGVIVTEDSKEEQEDAEYKKRWEWGEKVGAFHFTLKHTHFYPVQSEKMKALYEHITYKTEHDPSPELYAVNKNHYSQVYEYTPPADDEGIFKTITRRRTVRLFDEHQPVTQQQLVNCLYAGVGIIKFREVPPMGKMPLKTTPSGGARNPFEAYVLCRNVDGLPNGLYHYSATEHSLGLVNSGQVHTPAAILGDQLWINEAAVVVFLVANFERTMWKYSHPVGYKAVMLEAGHIAQNMILAANEYGFYGSPTAAVISTRFEELMEEKNFTKACVYAIAMGHAHAEAVELQ